MNDQQTGNDVSQSIGWGFEYCDDNGQWSDEACGLQDGSNTFATAEEALAQIPKIARCMECEESRLRAVELVKCGKIWANFDREMWRYVRQTAADNECSKREALWMMHDEPGDVARDLCVSESRVIEWLETQS